MSRLGDLRWWLARVIQPEVHRLEERLHRLDAWAARRDEELTAEFERGYREGFADGRDTTDLDDGGTTKMDHQDGCP